MSAYSPPTRRIPSCSSDYPQCEAKAHTLFPLPSHQIKTQNLSFLKRHRQILSFRVLKRQILLPFAQKQMKTLSVFAVALHPEGDRWSHTPCRYRRSEIRVALHPEGDRWSPEYAQYSHRKLQVALHPEGDRWSACYANPFLNTRSGRPPPGGRPMVGNTELRLAGSSGRPPPGGRPMVELRATQRVAGVCRPPPGGRG